MYHCPLYKHIASTLYALEHCKKFTNKELVLTLEMRLGLMSDKFPRSTGFTERPRISPLSTSKKLIIYGAYHNTDEYSMYGDWVHYRIFVLADMAHSITVRVTVSNTTRKTSIQRNYVKFKETVSNIFYEALTTQYPNSEFYENISDPANDSRL